MRPRGLSSGSLVTMTTWSWLMIIFIPSASHPITPCYFTITVQNHHEPSTDGCSYVCMNNCALLFRLRVPIGCTTELNHSGHQFLQQLFDKYDDVSTPTLSDFCSVSLFGFLILKQCFFFSIAGQRRRLVPDWTCKSVSSLSLHALGWWRLRVGAHHCWGIHLQPRLPLSVDVSVAVGWEGLWWSGSPGWVEPLCSVATRSQRCLISFWCEGFLLTWTSTVVWSIWGTSAILSSLSKSHRRLRSQVCVCVWEIVGNHTY